MLLDLKPERYLVSHMDGSCRLCLQTGPLGDLIMHNGTGSALAFHALFIAHPRSSGATRFVLHAAECPVSHDGRKHLRFDWEVTVFHGESVVFLRLGKEATNTSVTFCRFLVQVYVPVY